MLALTLGWSFIGTGLYALWRRPDQSIGRLMTVIGFLWFIGALPESDSALVFTVGLALAPLWSGPLVHLLVAFPTGHVAPGLERRLVRLGYAIPLLAPLGLLFLAQPSPDCPSCPENLLLVSDSPAAVDAVESVLGLLGIVLLVGVLVVLVRRWRRSGPVQRRALAPVVWTGAAVALASAVGLIPQAIGDEGAIAVANYLVVGCVTAVPFAFLAGLLRSSLLRASAVSALVERVGGTSVRDALAEALGDRDLTLAYWLPYPGGYVDADGRPVELPTRSRRAAGGHRDRARRRPRRGDRARRGAAGGARARPRRRRGGRARAPQRAPRRRAARPLRGAARLARPAGRRG